MIIPEFKDRELPQLAVLKRDNNLISQLSHQEANEFCSIGVVQGQAEWERFKTEILLPSKQTNNEFIDQISQNGYGYTFDITSKLECNTLIITGRQDHVVGYQDAWRLMEGYPRATFAVIDMAGHNLQIEQPDLFNALVHNWLDKLESEISEYK